MSPTYGSLTRMKYSIIYLSGARQKSYLAAPRRDKLSGSRQKSYLAVARRVIWRPPVELSCGRQKSYEGKSKITSSYCKTLIFRVTLFSRSHHPEYIPETLLSRIILFCSIILHEKLLARTSFSRLYGLANLRENKVLANKRCFTVVS